MCRMYIQKVVFINSDQKYWIEWIGREKSKNRVYLSVEAIKICWLRLDLPYLALAGLALSVFEFVWNALTVQYVCIPRLLLPHSFWFCWCLVTTIHSNWNHLFVIIWSFSMCVVTVSQSLLAVVPLLCCLIVLLACLLLWHLTYVCMYAIFI